MPQPPRILFLSGNAPPAIDGVGDYAARLLDALQSRRPEWRWGLLSRRPRWFSAPFTRRHGIPLFRPVRTWDAPRFASAATRALNPDILHVQEELYSFHETDAASRIAAAARGFLVTTLHEFHSDHPRIHRTIDLIEASDAVIANDLQTASRCLAATGRTVDRTLWSGATIRPPAPADRPPAIPGLAVTFGFLSALKCMETVHDALKVARVSRPDLRWRIIGPFEPETDPRHAALRDRWKDDSDWIEVVGAVDDTRRLKHLIAEAGMMLLPFADGASTRRGTLQTAWAFGLPVVTTAAVEKADAIRDGGNVLQADGVESWTDSILRIISDPNLAERLGREGLETAERFSWIRLADEHLAIYQAFLCG